MYLAKSRVHHLGRTLSGVVNDSRAWLEEDVNSLPAGRLPVGDVWFGDEDTGFSYGLSVVETAEGPALDAGTDEVACERLPSCLETVHFGELESPV